MALALLKVWLWLCAMDTVFHDVMNHSAYVLSGSFPNRTLLLQIFFTVVKASKFKTINQGGVALGCLYTPFATPRNSLKIWEIESVTKYM